MATRSGSPDPEIAPTDAGGDPLGRWCAALDDAYPPVHAESWDAVGLHVGDRLGDRVTGVLVTLDVTEAVLDEAAGLGADLVGAHHPLLFGPLARLTPTTAPGRLALRAARQGVAVLAVHTNVDKAVDGTSHPAADVLALQERRPLQPLAPDPGDAPTKIVTFAPTDATDAVIRAMAAAGAGVIGDYTECAFTTPGTGTFRPGDATDPHVGTRGQREFVAEDRSEVVAPRRHVPAIRAALAEAHPYEEVPIDLYPLVADPSPSAMGLGVRGRLPDPLPLAEVARRLADGLPSPHLRLAATDPAATATTVAICGGSGDSLIEAVLDADGRATVDVFVTGDLKHHRTLDALTLGLPLIDAGHFATEDPAMDGVVAALEARRDDFGLTAPIHRSCVVTDPWTDWRAPA